MYIHCIQHVERSIPFAASINHETAAARDTVLPNPALSRTSGHQEGSWVMAPSDGPATTTMTGNGFYKPFIWKSWGWWMMVAGESHIQQVSLVHWLMGFLYVGNQAAARARWTTADGLSLFTTNAFIKVERFNKQETQQLGWFTVPIIGLQL